MKDMKFKNRDNMKSVTKIQGQIWNMFEIFHKEAFGFHDLDLILLLLSLYKDDQISKDFMLKQQNLELTQLVSDSAFLYQKAQPDYQPIIDVFRSSLMQMSKVGFHDLIDMLFEIDKMTLKKNFRGIFEDTLYHIFSSQGRRDMPIQPIELTRFIYSLVKLPDNSKIFNPFAGLASFGVYLDKNQDYFGQEINQRNWALGVLRLMAHGKLESSFYMCDDAMLNWPEHSEKFDLIVSHPPLSHRINDRNLVRELGLNVHTIEQFLIKKGVDSLNEKGKLISILPQGFLFKGGMEKQIREDLVRQDLIDSVILLPAGLLPNTGIPLAVLVIDKAKEISGKVRFVNGDDFINVENKRVKKLKDEGLISEIQKGYDDSEYVRVVDNKDIIENDYNLNVPRYFMKKIEGTKLRDILNVIRGERTDLTESDKLVQIKNLKNDKVDFKLDISNIVDTEFRRQRVMKIEESCLLLSIRGMSLKPTLFEYTNTPIYINNNVLAFTIDENNVDVGYLINELYSDYVEEQLKSYSIGTIISNIRRDDLLEVVVKLPSLEEQKAKMKGFFEISDRIKKLEKQRDELVAGAGLKSSERVAKIRHSLGTPLLNIESAVDNIQDALYTVDENWGNIKLNEMFDDTLKNAFDSMKNDLTLIHTILKNNDTYLDVANHPLTEFDFIEFIKNYFKGMSLSKPENVKAQLEIDPLIKDDFKNEVFINGNKDLLKVAFNIIVDNAIKHGFIDNSKTYKLKIKVFLSSEISLEDVSDKRYILTIEVSNNGIPFPDNFDISKLVRLGTHAGITGNTGQGGYELDEIIKYHNNGYSSLELYNEDSSKEFTTTYLFNLPIKD